MKFLISGIVAAFLTLFSGTSLYSQNSIVQIPGFPDLFNLSVEQLSGRNYIFSGAHLGGNGYESVIGEMNNNTLIWSKRLRYLNGASYIVSDHVILPNGDIAVTGLTENGINTKIVNFLLDNIGDVITSSASVYGHGYPDAATHKIIHSPYTNSLIICGYIGEGNPLHTSISHDRVGFVSSLDANTLGINWASFMDSGSGGSDGDVVETICDLGQDGLFVSGSMNGSPSNGALLAALLDPSTGASIYAEGIDIDRHRPFGADAVLDKNRGNVLLLANDVDGMLFLCIDPYTGALGANHFYDNSLPENLFGHRIMKDEFENITGVAGYNLRNGNVHPFFYSLDYDPNTCSLGAVNPGIYFDASNSTVPNQHYQLLSSPHEFINTPDMAYSYGYNDYQLIGPRQSFSVDLDFHGGIRDSSCVIEFAPSMKSFNSHISDITQFDPIVFDENNANAESDSFALLPTVFCETPACPPCSIQVRNECGIKYEISLANCVNSAYSPSYLWSIPTLLPTTKSTPSFTVSDLGGSYPYTVFVSYFDYNGDWQVCQYNGILNIPNFDCFDLTMNTELEYICDNLYELKLSIDPSCLPFTVLDADLERTNALQLPTGCFAFQNESSTTITFDASTCGTGWYNLDALIEITDDNNDNIQCLNRFFNPPLAGPKSVWVEQVCDPSIVQVQGQFNLFGQGPEEPICPPSANSYGHYQVVSPINNGCYLYYWNGSSVPQSPHYYCCDTDPNCLNPSLLVVDTCNCCNYYIPDVNNRSSEIPEIIVTEDVAFYPNPTDRIMNIQFDAQADRITSIIDLKGVVINEFRSNQDLIKINVESWIPGIYIAKIQNKETGQVTSHKIIVQ